MNIIEAVGISKSFPLMSDSNDKDAKISVLNNVSFTLETGKTLGIVGYSGSGKTTFLQICGQIDTPDSGYMMFNGVNCNSLSATEKNAILSKEISFIFQFHHLFPEFSALENIFIPLILSGVEEKIAVKMAEDAIDLVGLNLRKRHFPHQLSGGEKQRIAVARTIVKKPKLILADEPTGNLDPKTGEMIFDLMLDLVKNFNISLICVTHNDLFASKLDRTLSMINGELK